MTFRTATRRLSLAALVLATAPAAAQQFQLPPENSGRTAVSGRTHQIDHCVIGLVTQRNLAATEPGILTYVGVKVGSRFQAEDIIAEIDTREAEQAYKKTQAEYQHTLMRADDKIEEEYADAQEKVERADLEEIYEANKRLPGTVPEAEVRKEQLEWKRAQLGGDKARKDRKLALKEVSIKQAEMQMAEIAIEKRRVRAKFGGEVLKLNREEGEWVQPGDTIAEVARLDLLQVDGFVYFDEFDQRDIENCRVTISVPIAPGRTEEATGYIVYVDPLAEYAGGSRPQYRVRAEVANRLEQGRWAISPGLNATMTIHLGTKGEGPTVGGVATQKRAAR